MWRDIVRARHLLFGQQEPVPNQFNSVFEAYGRKKLNNVFGSDLVSGCRLLENLTQGFVKHFRLYHLYQLRGNSVRHLKRKDPRQQSEGQSEDAF